MMIMIDDDGDEDDGDSNKSIDHKGLFICFAFFNFNYY